MKNAKRILRRWGRFALEAAPTFCALNRQSHPVAWVAAFVHLVNTAGRFSASKSDFSEGWPELTYTQTLALANFLCLQGIGEPVESGEKGVRIYECRGMTYGIKDDNVTILRGRPGADRGAPIRALWKKCPSILLTSTSVKGICLQADSTREILDPPARIIRLSKDCLDLKAAGHQVGVLLDGPPGSGKSQALLYIAKNLGGKVLRTSLQMATPEDLACIALCLKPDAIILDDVDRGNSDKILDAVDRIYATKAAILASSNNSKNICQALLREGRIDDHHVLSAIEPDVLERIRHRISDEESAQLNTLPVAAVMRYLAIRDSIGHDRAQGYLKSRGQ